MRTLLDEGRDLDEADAPLGVRWVKIGRCMEIIKGTAPTRLAGCAAKLRLATDAEVARKSEAP